MKWSDIIDKEALDLGVSLAAHAQEERDNGKLICPKQEQIFRALELTPPEKTKVVIVGQDPYHTPGQANGLAFSVAPDAPLQPSLKNIFKELQSDMDCGSPPNGDLTAWAERGVLLLNSTLTVYEHQANSHAKWGWKTFTSAVLDAAVHLPQPIVFMLWVAMLKNLQKKLIIKASMLGSKPGTIRQNLVKKDIIMSSHPSPFSANKWCRGTPPFLGNKPFSTANDFLMDRGSEPIDWVL